MERETLESKVLRKTMEEEKTEGTVRWERRSWTGLAGQTVTAKSRSLPFDGGSEGNDSKKRKLGNVSHDNRRQSTRIR